MRKKSRRVKARKRKQRRRTFTYKGCKMASKAEVKFAEAMDEKGISWMYESESFPWVPPKKKYTPDFMLYKKDGGKMFIEYKGYLRPTDKTKMKAIRNQYPDLDLRFVFQNARKPIYKGSKTTYAMWAERHGYLWAEGFIPNEWIKEVA
jgi:predicted nuclease of restriction endonuclease-like RecB superfamily